MSSQNAWSRALIQQTLPQLSQRQQNIVLDVRGSLNSLVQDGVEEEDQRQATVNILEVAIVDLQLAVDSIKAGLTR